MPEPIRDFSFEPTYNAATPAWRRVELERIRKSSADYFGAKRTAVLEHWPELVIGGAIGFGVRNGVTIGLVAIGAQGLPVLIAAGAVSGAAISTYREYQKVKNFKEIDYGVVFRGAAIGGAGALAGGLLRDAVSGINFELPRLEVPAVAWFQEHNPVRFIQEHNPVSWTGDRIQEIRNRTVIPEPISQPIVQPKATATAVTVIATEVPTAVPKPTIVPTLQPTTELTPLPNPTIQPIPKPVIPPVEPLLLPVPGPLGPGTIPVLPQFPNLAEKVVTLENNLEINKALQAEVYEKVVRQDQFVAEALKPHGKSLSDFPPAQLAKVNLAVQHAIESKANFAMDQAVKTVVIDHPTLDLSDHGNIELVKSAQKATFEQLFNDPVTHAELMGIAQNNITLDLTPPSVPDVISLPQFLETSVTISQPGDTIWNSMHFSDNYFENGLGHGWVNPINGVTQEDVVKDLIAKMAKANGHNLNMVHVGDSYQINQVLTLEQMEIIKETMKSPSAQHYWNVIRPKALRWLA